MTYKLIFYSLISLFLLYLFTSISYKLNLVDLPTKRKIHSNPTAFTGGITIIIILLIGAKTFDILDDDLTLIISISFLIACVGFIDDIYNLNTGGKLSLQCIPVFYLIVFEKMILTDIGDYNLIKLELGSFAMPFTILCVLLLINSFNYFDGIDGTLGFTMLSVLLLLVFLISNTNFLLFIYLILIPLCIFLLFNFSIFKLPKLFLGDNGSLLFGFIVSFLLILLATKKIVHPILLAWTVSIFVYEFLSINLIRIKNRKYLFQAGQDHVHHLLFKKTKSVFYTNLFIFLINFTFFAIGYFSFYIINPLISLINFIIIFIIYLYFRNLYLKKNKLFI